MPDAPRLISDPQQQTFRFSASCRSKYAVPVRAGYVGSRRKLSVGRRDNGGSQCGYSPPFMAHDALPEDVWGTKEVDDLLKVRLDRLTRELAGARRDIDVLLESLSLFVRYQLMVTAPLPEADTAARAIGRDRFEAFVSQVGRHLAGGKRTLIPPEADGAAS
jgi:hypothetical protein